MTTGDVFQIEIRVRDFNEAMRFYGNAFSWGIYPSSPAYALIDPGQMPIGSMLQDIRLPLGVCPLVLVTDCAATANRARELGGKIVIPRSEVPGSGAYTAALDPWGNELCFWEPFTSDRPRPAHAAVNPFVFMEIATPNLAKAKAYYGELLGWRFVDSPTVPSFALVEGCGFARGVGLLGGDAAASGIITYIEVADLAERQPAIEQHGGKVVVPPMDFPGGGRAMIVADPSGNRLGVVEARR